MIGIVVTGHGSFPNGIYESVRLIAGDVEKLEVVPFEEDQDKLEEALLKAIEVVDEGEGVVCFADLAGGTPFNVSSRIASTRDQVHVIGGTNSPMLLSGLFQRKQPIDSFVTSIISEGKESIKAFEVKKKRAVNESDGI
ncbi:PTS sugar transporter subunit IIA [Virgibacillus sp. Bac332]|uniref:PTS sugar transporter subunit IIA n=1 Tax=Virgibacillus sp. Bac332 TaxID=2419842 RepID=UPI0013CEFC18|nr:PTS sugar transporter [Virgibacillus sp. Bac332]